MCPCSRRRYGNSAPAVFSSFSPCLLLFQQFQAFLCKAVFLFRMARLFRIQWYDIALIQCRMQVVCPECGAMVQFQCLHYFFYGQLTLIQYFHQSKDLVGAWSVLGRCLVGAWSVCNLTFEYQRYTVRPYPVFRFGQSGFATLGHHQSYAASPAFQNLPLVQDIGQQWILWFRFML